MKLVYLVKTVFTPSRARNSNATSTIRLLNIPSQHVQLHKSSGPFHQVVISKTDSDILSLRLNEYYKAPPVKFCYKHAAPIGGNDNINEVIEMQTGEI